MIGAMTYDQLVAFLGVAGEGTFTAASAALHKSQPAVSKLVRNLEDELGVQLFDREQYRAPLPDAGRLFPERAASESGARYCSRSKSWTPSSSSRLRTSLLTAGCDL